MGNCCTSGSSSSVVWAGDDWGPLRQEKSAGNYHSAIMERQRLLGEEMDGGYISSNSSSPSSAREVKIKITKRELEELMAKVDMQGFSMEQLLDRLLNASVGQTDIIMDHHHQQRSWKPVLQSIPEVN